MYEKLRNDFSVELAKIETDNDKILSILEILDRVSANYNFTSNETRVSTFVDYDLPEIVKIYLVTKKIAGLSDATLYNYKTHLGLFFRIVGKLPTTVTTNDIRLFLYKYQLERNISARTLDKYREYICHFFTWAFEEGYIEKNPTKNIDSIKYEIKPRESLSQIELEYLRNACTNDKERAIIEFLYSTGCRVSELTNVKKQDINWNDKSVQLFGKGKKYRVCFINAKAEVALKNYLNIRTDDSDYLFVSSRKPYKQLHKDGVEKIIRKLSDKIFNLTGKKITPHILRHTMATTALYSGMPIVNISKLLGHENVDTTMIYAKTSIEEVKNEHKKYII